MSTSADNRSMKLNFKEDTLTTASRDAVRALAKTLGFNETQTILYAIARLRDEVLPGVTDPEKLVALTKSQHQIIARFEPVGKGAVRASLL